MWADIMRREVPRLVSFNEMVEDFEDSVLSVSSRQLVRGLGL